MPVIWRACLVLKKKANRLSFCKLKVIDIITVHFEKIQIYDSTMYMYLEFQKIWYLIMDYRKIQTLKLGLHKLKKLIDAKLTK